MITALDHVVVLVSDLSRAIADTEALLGRGVSWQTASDGVETALITLDNTSIELMAATGAGEAADRVRAALAERGEGLASMAFRVADIAKAERRLTRLGLTPESIVAHTSRNAINGASLSWSRTRAAKEATHGIRQFFLELDGERPVSPMQTEAEMTGLDHIVIGTPSPERAAALYGARLGLDMRLDRTNPDWGVRLMFFRCGDMIVEIAHALKGGSSDRPDSFRGLSWRVQDADATRERLAAGGFNVSEVRIGRKPGTKVFTVRDRNCNVPTIIIQPPKQA